MHAENTKNIFDVLAVFTRDDALAMTLTIVGLARSMFSRPMSRHFNSVSLMDLPCEAFEFAGVLAASKRYMKQQGGIRVGGDKAVIQWLTQQLPVSVEGLKKMGTALRIRTQKHSTRGDGTDAQAASAVTLAWLTQPDRRERARRGRPSSEWQDGKKGVFGLPSLHCHDCGEFLKDKATSGHVFGSRVQRCSACRRDARNAPRKRASRRNVS